EKEQFCRRVHHIHECGLGARRMSRSDVTVARDVTREIADLAGWPEVPPHEFVTRIAFTVRPDTEFRGRLRTEVTQKPDRVRLRLTGVECLERRLIRFARAAGVPAVCDRMKRRPTRCLEAGHTSDDQLVDHPGCCPWMHDQCGAGDTYMPAPQERGSAKSRSLMLQIGRPGFSAAADLGDHGFERVTAFTVTLDGFLETIKRGPGSMDDALLHPVGDRRAEKPLHGPPTRKK